MDTMLEQVLILLNSETGSLAYHLVLAFSIIGALALTQGQWEHNPSPRTKRNLIGLSLLLGMQLLLFVGAGLAWQGVIPGETLLPPLDRAVTLISLVLIVWLWAFPLPSSSADMGTLLLVFLILTGSVFSTLWWSAQAEGALFNGSLSDTLMQVGALLVLFMGCLVLILRRPPGWQMGLPMLLLLAAGPIAHFILLPYGENYPSIIRLTQMAAYPFLLVLPRYVDLPSTPDSKNKTPRSETDRQDTTAVQTQFNTQLWESLLQLFAESEPESAQNLVTAALAKSMQADVCLLLEPPNPHGVIHVRSAYNRQQNQYLGPAVLEGQSVPMLASAFKLGRVRRLSSQSESPDSKTLARFLNVGKTGNILFVPVLSDDGTPQTSVALMSPYTQRVWTSDQQSFLGLLAKVLFQYLKRSQEMADLQDQLQHSKQAERRANEQTQQAREKTQKLRDKLAVLEEGKQRDAAQIASMAALAAAQDAAQRSIDDLMQENDALKKFLNQAAEDSEPDSKPLEGELRLALEEVAYLTAALELAEKKFSEMPAQEPQGKAASPDQVQVDEILEIAQDLRQPLSSVVGYADFLLGESIGILGAKQRKFLERIKKSTERMEKLVDDLVQKVSPQSNAGHLELEEIDLGALIQSVLEDSGEINAEKQLSVTAELPDQGISIYSDQQSLQKIFTELLHNAGAVTPEGGQISVSARLEHSDTEDDYALIQVADQGGGIEPQDLARVFLARDAEDRIQGIASDNGYDLSSVKALVEVLGGRTWVDSMPGQGATFSVLLPVSSTLDNKNGGGGLW